MTDFLIKDLDDDLMRLIEAKAEAMGISVEELARLAVIEHVKDVPDTEVDRQASGAKHPL